MHCLSDCLAAYTLTASMAECKSAICDCDVAKSFCHAIVVTNYTPALDTSNH